MSGQTVGRPAIWTNPWLIVGVALLLRLCWAALVPIDPVSDGVLYEAFAKSIVAGHGYAFPDGVMTEYWPVGTSATYALLFFVFGEQPWILPLFQAILGAYIVLLTWRLADRLFSARVAALAAWLTSIWPLLIEFTTICASELLFIAVVLTSLNIWIARRMPFPLQMVLWGTSVAAATYVRPTALPLIVLFPAIRWILDRDWIALVKGVLIAGVTASLLFAPWTYRSISLFERFVVVSANGGVNLWMGNNPESSGGYMVLPDRHFPTEVDRDQFYGREAIKFIVGHPLRYVTLSLNRAAMTFDRETIGIVWNQKALGSIYQESTLKIMKLTSSAYWWTLLLAGAFGVFLALRRRLYSQAWPILAVLAYFSAFPILTVAMDRYHVPIDPLLAIFAAYAICSIADDLYLRRHG